MRLVELKQIAKENKIVIPNLINRPELVKILREHDLISEDEPLVSHRNPPRPEKVEKDPGRPPRVVEITDIKTGIKTIYHSLYNAGRVTGINPSLLRHHIVKGCKGRLCYGKYEVKLI